jgi:nucleotide-binding universal stress UspA family protein
MKKLPLASFFLANIAHATTDVVTSQSIHHGIFEELKEANAVLGTRGRTGFKKLLLGTTAEGLINKTPCSALAVKPADFHFSLH